jgi:3-isopropylmalate dehydrogenase
VLVAVAEALGLHLEFSSHLIGGAALDEYGNPLPPETLRACKEADAVLLGAVGGPEWDRVDPHLRPEQGLLKLRAGLGVFANLRPVSAGASDALRGRAVDVLIVRELTGGIYFGQPSDRRLVDGVETARDTMEYSRPEIERIARVGFDWARRRRGRVTSVDKANVLETSRLWRETVEEIHQGDYPDVDLNNEYVDIAAMKLITSPEQFDVIVTGNLFGDVLSDLAAAIPGSIGVLPSASIGQGPGLFEPVHGSAPDIAGTGKANPVGAILSAAMMLDALAETEASCIIQGAVEKAIEEGARTEDMSDGAEEVLGTIEMTNEVLARIQHPEEAIHG